MDDKTLIQELRRLECRDNLQCLGCGYEHGCSLRGCAIIKRAVERLERLTAAEPNDPLTLEELREMDGEPVYMMDLTGGTLWNQWIIFQKSTDDGFIPSGGGWFGAENYGKTWLAYRRKPEEGTS